MRPRTGESVNRGGAVWEPRAARSVDNLVARALAAIAGART